MHDEASPIAELAVAGRMVQPEERLMIEVLALACADLSLRARGAEADAMRAEARAWIESDDEGWPLSFASICRHFGIEPAAMRRRLLAGGPGLDRAQPQAA